ncbi:MAG TPA: hypothetical protein VH092_07680 [Urbifossiella sp.]|nr:hypothetical protein [Urbifossiella sp.]
MRFVTCGLCAWVVFLSTSCTDPHLPVAKRGVIPDTDDTVHGLTPAPDRPPGDPSPTPVASSSAESDVPAAPEAAVRAAVVKAHAVLWKGVEGHAEHRSCFSCHNHGTSMLAFTTARGRGFVVPEQDVADLTVFISDYLAANRDKFLRGQGPGPLSLGGATDTTGWALFALELGGKTPDEVTAAAVEYTLRRDQDRDHWGTWGPARPPAEDSIFMATALAIRGLQVFGRPEHAERIAKRVEAARGWLIKTPARHTEDRVYRVLGLKAAGAPAEDVRRAGTELAQTQRADGGWAQTDAMASDAYATGSALTALQMWADMPPTDPVYRRGVAYLLRTQLADGSWRVRSHSVPFQPYYESGFPHGKDQFISCAATGWAATALALACPAR